jgi:hypothetical protein
VRSIKPSGVVIGTWKARDQDIIDSPSRSGLPIPIEIGPHVSADLGCIGRQAELERFKHAPRIGIRSGFANRLYGISGRDYSLSPPSAQRKRPTLESGIDSNSSDHGERIFNDMAMLLEQTAQ